MIELPESYVLAEQIEQTLMGRTVRNVTVGATPHGFAWYSGDSAAYQALLSGKRLTGANPGTGYTCGGNTEVNFEDTLMVFSTPVRYHAPGDKLPAKHQLLIEFDDDSHMSCTVQMWGSMLCYPANNITLPEGYTVNKSPSPLEAAFDEAYFDGLMQGLKPTLSVKALLATEQRIPGLGNGVLQDILFNAHLHPKRKLQTLLDADLRGLFDSVKKTLLRMRLEGGRDTERDLFSTSGGYKTILSSKTAKGPCPVCRSGIVREAYLGGNVYFCPTCQGFP